MDAIEGWYPNSVISTPLWLRKTTSIGIAFVMLLEPLPASGRPRIEPLQPGLRDRFACQALQSLDTQFHNNLSKTPAAEIARQAALQKRIERAETQRLNRLHREVDNIFANTRDRVRVTIRFTQIAAADQVHWVLRRLIDRLGIAADQVRHGDFDILNFLINDEVGWPWMEEAIEPLSGLLGYPKRPIRLAAAGLLARLAQRRRRADLLAKTVPALIRLLPLKNDEAQAAMETLMVYLERDIGLSVLPKAWPGAVALLTSSSASKRTAAMDFITLAIQKDLITAQDLPPLFMAAIDNLSYGELSDPDAMAVRNRAQNLMAELVKRSIHPELQFLAVSPALHNLIYGRLSQPKNHQVSVIQRASALDLLTVLSQAQSTAIVDHAEIFDALVEGLANDLRVAGIERRDYAAYVVRLERGGHKNSENSSTLDQIIGDYAYILHTKPWRLNKSAVFRAALERLPERDEYLETSLPASGRPMAFEAAFIGRVHFNLGEKSQLDLNIHGDHVEMVWLQMGPEGLESFELPTCQLGDYVMVMGGYSGKGNFMLSKGIYRIADDSLVDGVLTFTVLRHPKGFYISLTYVGSKPIGLELRINSAEHAGPPMSSDANRLLSANEASRRLHRLEAVARKKKASTLVVIDEQNKRVTEEKFDTVRREMKSGQLKIVQDAAGHYVLMRHLAANPIPVLPPSKIKMPPQWLRISA